MYRPTGGGGGGGGGASGGERAHDRLHERVTQGDTLRGQPRREGGAGYGDELHERLTQGDSLRRRLEYSYPPDPPSLKLSPAASMGSRGSSIESQESQDPPEPPAHPRPAQYVSTRGQPSTASALHVGSSVGVFTKKLGRHTPGTVEHVYKADDGQLVLRVGYWVGQKQYQKTVREADCKRLDAVPLDDGPLQRATAASTSDSSVLSRPLVGAHADGDETHDPGSSRRASRCWPRPCCPDPVDEQEEPVGQTQPWVGLTYRPRERIAPGNDVGPPVGPAGRTPVEMTLEDAMLCANENPTIKGFTFDEREAGGRSAGTLIRVWFKGKGAHLTDDSWRRSELLHETDWASFIKGLPQDEQGDACFFNPETGETVQEDRLVGQFRDPEASVRRFAVEALGQLAPRRLANYAGRFVPLLRDQEAEVRRAAVTGLGRLEPERLVGYWDNLVRRLGDPDIGVREAVVMALGQLLHSQSRDSPPGVSWVPPDDPARDRYTQRDIRKLLAVTRQLESIQAGNDRQRCLSSLTPDPGGQSTIIQAGLRYYQSSIDTGTRPGLTQVVGSTVPDRWATPAYQRSTGHSRSDWIEATPSSSRLDQGRHGGDARRRPYPRPAAPEPEPELAYQRSTGHSRSDWSSSGPVDSEDEHSSSSLYQDDAVMEPPPPPLHHRLEVIFAQPGLLGIDFHRNSTPPLVINQIVPGTLAAAQRDLRVGMALVEIQGVSTAGTIAHGGSGMPYHEVLSRLRQAERPLTLVFEHTSRPRTHG